jgi:hypothetical protein
MEIDTEEQEADVVELAPSPVKAPQTIEIIWDDDKIEKVSLRAFIVTPASLWSHVACERPCSLLIMLE